MKNVIQYFGNERIALCGYGFGVQLFIIQSYESHITSYSAMDGFLPLVSLTVSLASDYRSVLDVACYDRKRR